MKATFYRKEFLIKALKKKKKLKTSTTRQIKNQYLWPKRKKTLKNSIRKQIMLKKITT